MPKKITHNRTKHHRARSVMAVTTQEVEFLDLLDSLDAEGREFGEAPAANQGRLERRTDAERERFALWMDGTADRPIAERIVALRTGAWRDEMTPTIVTMHARSVH